jgi:hypothetical protein
MTALDSGLKCADALREFMADEKSDILELYSSWYENQFQTFEKHWRYYYNVETRWKDSEFWKRRQPQESK